MKKIIYPGSFDPITIGHLELIERASLLCDQLIIAIGKNPEKKTMFSVYTRLQQINSSLDELNIKANIIVKDFDGLLTDFAIENDANIIVRGIRSVSDFEYEFVLANANKLISSNIETIFLPASPKLSLISSSMVKQIKSLGGDVSKFVTKCVNNDLNNYFRVT